MTPASRRKKTCTPEQLELAEQRIKNEKNFITQLMMGSLLMSIGISRIKEDENRAQVKELKDEISTIAMQKWEYVGKLADEARRANDAEQKQAEAEGKLAPYLADDKRKAEVAADAAAKQQLNQMAQDATTLQGEIKVAKKPISIKQTPPQT